LDEEWGREVKRIERVRSILEHLSGSLREERCRRKGIPFRACGPRLRKPVSVTAEDKGVKRKEAYVRWVKTGHLPPLTCPQAIENKERRRYEK
jgi:hypothetical protein